MTSCRVMDLAPLIASPAQSYLAVAHAAAIDRFSIVVSEVCA
jgi:hypothetical protein